VYSVSRLTLAIKDLLEGEFHSFWVEGQISNFRVPSSGHFYFTLKDEESQIRAVMFRSRNTLLRFLPEDGMQVICRGDLSVYPPRGEYQVIIDLMEPKGVGALQLAFEALKQRLAAEGLFDGDRKRPLPFLPRVVGIVTSPAGAAIRDIVKILWRRFPNLELVFCPVRVQGEGAAQEISEALKVMNEDGSADVIIVGRGGGSLEDLWAFNEEVVARAISASQIPVVSAVGHEIDFTIADFVADLRASTPSAAAEIVVPEKIALVQAVEGMSSRLNRSCKVLVERTREKIRSLTLQMVSPGKRIQEYRIRLDELSEKMRSCLHRRVDDFRRGVTACKEKIIWMGPSAKLQTLGIKLDGLQRLLVRAAILLVEERKKRCAAVMSCLETMSPLRVLARGYSITRLLPDRKVLLSFEDVDIGERVEVILSEGLLECAVEKIKKRGVP